MDNAERELADVEWKAWLEIVDHTTEIKAITKEDWEGRPSDFPTTPGTKLIHLIREWGDKLAELRVYQDNRPGV